MPVNIFFTGGQNGKLIHQDALKIKYIATIVENFIEILCVKMNFYVKLFGTIKNSVWP